MRDDETLYKGEFFKEDYTTYNTLCFFFW